MEQIFTKPGHVDVRPEDGRRAYFLTQPADFDWAVQKILVDNGGAYGLPGTDGAPVQGFLLYTLNSHPVSLTLLVFTCGLSVFCCGSEWDP
jgi:hypothetical protein